MVAAFPIPKLRHLCECYLFACYFEPSANECKPLRKRDMGRQGSSNHEPSPPTMCGGAERLARYPRLASSQTEPTEVSGRTVKSNEVAKLSPKVGVQIAILVLSSFQPLASVVCIALVQGPGGRSPHGLRLCASDATNPKFDYKGRFLFFLLCLCPIKVNGGEFQCPWGVA